MSYIFHLTGTNRRHNLESLSRNLLVIFFYFACLVIRYGNFKVIKIFEDHNSTLTFNHFVIDKNNGHLFVGAINRIFELTPDLRVTNQVVTGPLEDSFECGPDFCPKDVIKNLTDNMNKVLVIDYNASRIIACGTISQGMCTVRSLNNISNAIPVKTPIAANSREASTVAFIAPGPPNPPVTQVMYIGVTFTANSPYRDDVPAIASRSLDSRNMLDIANVDITSGTRMNVENLYRKSYLINYVYGFTSESFSYFLTTQKSNTNPLSLHVSKIVRLCHEDQSYYSYTEIVLECTSKYQTYNLVQAAYVGKIGSELALDLGITPQDDVLFAVFSSSNHNESDLSHKPNDKSALCIYSLKSINRKFTENIQACFRGKGYRGLDFILSNDLCAATKINITEHFCGIGFNTPLGGDLPIVTVPVLIFNTRLTAVTATSTGHFTVVFVGTKNGHIKKIVVESTVKAIQYDDVVIQENYEINSDLIVDPQQINLYAMTPNRISIVKIHECHLHSSCLDCLAAKDPYCGWCSLDSKCVLRSSCKNASNDPLNWIPYNSRKCPAIVSVTPNHLHKTSAQTLKLVIDNFPLFEGPFFCIFSLFDQVIITNATRYPFGVNCTTPQTYLHFLRPNKHNFTAKLSVKTEKGLNFVDTFFTIFDCNTYTSCTQCVSSSFACDWCTGAHICTHDTVDDCKNDTIIIGMNRINSSFRSGPSYCPSINNPDTESNEILIPSGVKKRLRVKMHMVHQLMIHSKFLCKFNIEGRIFSVNSVLLDNTLECGVIDFRYYSNFSNITATFDILWDESKPLDNPQHIHIVLYKCRYLADDCGMCLTLSENYRCGWCSGSKSCEIMDHCNQAVSTWINRNNTCPDIQIKSFWPQTGPWEGHTNITIVGKNLGKNFSDIYSGVTVAGHRCHPYPHLYEIARKIVCRVDGTSSNDTKEGPVVVQVEMFTGESQSNYRFVDPVITGLYPLYGPKSGGTILTVKGHFMNTGSNIQVFFEDTLPCIVINSTLNETRCITSASDSQKKGKIKILFDKSERNFDRQTFEYTDDPSVESVKSGVLSDVDTPKGIVSGGTKVYVHGKNFEFVQNPRLYVYYANASYFNDCFKLTGSDLICESPEITPLKKNQPESDKPLELDYGFKMDNVTVVQNISMKKGFFKFQLYADPLFIEFDDKYKLLKSDYLIINGHRLNQVCQKTDITVHIGTSYCNVTSFSKNQLACKPPSNQPPAASVENDGSSNSLQLPDVIISVGSSFNVNIGKLEYASFNHISIIESPTFYGFVGLIIIFTISIVILMVYRRKSTENIRVLKCMQEQMNIFEFSVASECKTAFADLQTEMIDITDDLTSDDIPFLDYQTYSLKILFPNILNQEIFQRDNYELIQYEKGIRLFKQLVLNKAFLLLFIRTLECNNCFSMKDRVNVASLIMVSLQSEMEYCTDILKTLLSEAIKKLKDGRRNPKLFMRSTGSIVEKMLTFWFTFLLYDFLRECAGKPLYSLLKAMKQQIDKGPVDAITSEARYSLCEKMLIRQSIDFVPMTVHVSIYQRISRVTELDLKIKNIPVKVLNCDTISQVKEKALDTIYRDVHFSRRPRIYEFDVEWKTSPSSQTILYDDDFTTIVEGNWKKRNTLHHYMVPDGAYLNLVPVKQISTYNLSTLSDIIDEYETLSSKKNNSDSQSLVEVTSPLNIDRGDHLKHWHLVKNCDQDGQKEEKTEIKMVSEIYLTRLLATKNALKTFVDDLFETILSTAHKGRSLPVAIKFMFDFFDDQAIQHGITDHEVIQTWKVNSLPLRFWVNLIKNPDFIFDVHKSDNIDSCLSVVAEALMDSFSMSDHQLGKDSPSSKLLYAKDIPVYKSWVKRYFRDIQNMPAISHQEMNAILAYESRIHKLEFNTNYACYELYGYATKYNEQLIANLETDEFSQNQRLAYKLEKLHNLMTIGK